MKTLFLVSKREDGTFSLCELSKKGEEIVYKDDYEDNPEDLWGEWKDVNVSDIVKVLEETLKDVVKSS